jgi:hypothetical protein
VARAASTQGADDQAARLTVGQAAVVQGRGWSSAANEGWQIEQQVRVLELRAQQATP